MVFSGMDMYKACREAGGVDPENINEGIMMSWLAKALVTKGRSRRLNGAWQPRDIQYGADSTYRVGNDREIRKVLYNNWLIYTGQAQPPRMSVHIGIPIYDAFLSPKTINGVSWVYWQTGTWGGFRGGHALVPVDWSDLIKLTATSRGSFLLPNTWADSGFPQSRMSAEAFMKCIAADGEIIISVSKVLGPPAPTGKLELAEPFILIPAAPRTGDKVKVHFAVKNTGDAPLSGVKLAVEDRVDTTGGPGFGFEGPFDLPIGAVHSYEPERPEPVTEGHWRFRGDRMDVSPVVLTGAVVEVDVTGEPPPPPPPPPTDTRTVNLVVGYTENSVTWSGVADVKLTRKE